jgi:hypothetical protein
MLSKDIKSKERDYIIVVTSTLLTLGITSVVPQVKSIIKTMLYWSF